MVDLFAAQAAQQGVVHAPLADRMRPRLLDEVVGQGSLLSDDSPLRQSIASGKPPSMILWGPPGSGKTTLAHVIAAHTEARMVPFSAVTGGIPEVRRIIATAAQAQSRGEHTILFVDEMHRFNKAQQDAFLPHVERGTITLIGATTENPSFEVIGALLSRMRVFVLEPLGIEDLALLLDRALTDARGLGDMNLEVAPDAQQLLLEAADGDARRLLTTLELAAETATDQGDGRRSISRKLVAQVLGGRTHRYDKSGEEHYNLISALHKSLRGSDANAALYWFYRMIESGEDPLYIARRLIRFAVEDVGLGDPQALVHTVAARDAYKTLGSPEGELALSQAVAYLAYAPKDVRVYLAEKAIRDVIRENPDLPVPLHLRNAPTDLLNDLGYGKDYRYPPTDSQGGRGQAYLPPELEGESWISTKPESGTGSLKE